MKMCRLIYDHLRVLGNYDCGMRDEKFVWAAQEKTHEYLQA